MSKCPKCGADMVSYCEMLHSLRRLRDKWNAMREAMIGMQNGADNDMHQRLLGGVRRLTDCIDDLDDFIKGYK